MRGSAVFIWNDRALFVGDRSETARHAHDAVEISIALDPLGVRVAAQDVALCEPAVVVAANTTHQLTVVGPKVAVLYVDARSPAGAGVQAWLNGRELAALDPHGFTAFTRLLEDDAGIDDASRAIGSLLDPFVDEAPRLDPRVRRAMYLLETRLDAPPSQAELADELGLSATRLRHLFKDNLGLPMRRFVLWMRLRAALRHALAGTPMTQAAVEAGFSDGAHFTRTCQQMFGLPPTQFAPVDALFVAD